MKQIVFIILFFPAFSYGHHNWEHSKRQVYDRDQGKPTFYCGCSWDAKRVDLDSCGYTPRKNATRAKRTEVEHIVPAYRFGYYRDCWVRGGRSDCYKNDTQFRACHNDLNNLAVAVGEINGDRSNYRFGFVPGEPRAYGQCDFEVYMRQAEPPPAVRKVIAQTYIYMSKKCGFEFTEREQHLFDYWRGD